MRNLNFFGRSAMVSEGSTLASTVVKHLAFMLLFLLGSLNVWGDNAAVDDVLWGETFDHFVDGTTQKTPAVAGTGTGTTIWGSATITYAQSSNNTKGYDAVLAGGTAPELLLSQSNQTWTISGIPTGGATEMALSFKSNKTTFAVTTSTANLSISGSQKSWTITVDEGKDTPETFVLVIKNTGSSNARIDDVALTVVTAAAGGGSEKTDITDLQLAWSDESASVTYGDEPYSLPTLTNTIPVSVSYQSTDETVATISNTGVVSILKAGSTTIKAIFAGDETYKAKTVQYTLTVSPAPLIPIVGGIVDELVISDFEVTGGYTAFTDKQASNAGHSNAVYAGKAARGGNSTQYNIQLNTIGTGTSAGRGIVTTTSGGNAKRVQAIWGTTGTGNTNDRYLTVYGSNSAYTGSETTTSGTNLGTITFHTGDEYAYLDIVGDYPYIMIVASGAMYIDQINITWLAADETKVATPSIDGTANFYPSTNVTITCGTDDADIYYTTDGTAPSASSASSTKYTGAFSVNNTTTIKAIAVKDGMTDSEVAEATFTKITPLTVAQALVEATGSGKYVTGTITSITEVNIGYKNATYVISDISAGIPQNEMIVYRGKYVGGADFTSADQIHVGDVVVVSGSIAVHAEKNQMAQGNQIETISAPAVAAPVFDPNGGGFVVSTDVTITAAGAEHIYYTTNGDNPTKASNEYTGAIPLDATTTIKAIAYIGEESSLVVEKTFTLTDPKTVAEAYDELVSADLENVAVEGIVYDLSISSGNATYWISDDGNAGAKVLEVFKGKGIEGADVAAGDIREGDKVIVFGTLTIYTGGSEDVKEFKQGSRLLSLTRKTVETVAVTGTPTKANYKVGDAFDPAGLTVTVTYDDASHATVAVADCSWEKDPATFDAAGTGLSVSVKATYDGVQSPAYLVEGLTVKAIPTFDDPNYEWQLVTSDAQLVAGKYYVIASASAGNTAIKTITSGYLGTVASTIADGVIAYNALGENTAIFELGGESGAWTLVEAIEEKQLTGATTANFVWDGATNTTWPISIDGENAIIGASDGYRVLYNVNSPRFKPYNSATSASMVLPQLYVWALKTNKLRYDANGGENAPAAQAADGEGKANVTDDKPTAPADKVFDKWNTQNDGLGADKVAGDEIDLSAGDVTLYAIWRDPNTYSISYDANGGALIDGETALDPENVTEGNSYTVKANVYKVEGKIFMGWKAADVIYNAGQVIHPTEDMAFVAQWGNPIVTDFMLVTDVKQLKDGDKVYIVADGKNNMALGELSGSVRNPVEITKQNNHIVNIGNDPVELTLGKSGDDYTFYDGANYLAWSSGNSLTNASSVSDNYIWNITINEGVTKIANKHDDAREIRYNSGSPRFAAYAGTQQHVSIYKRPDYSRDVTEGRFGTICLPKAGKMDGAAIYEVAYIDNSLNKIFFDEVMDGAMSAGMPYIFLPNAGIEKLGVYYSDNTADDVDARHHNGLYGSYTEEVIPAGAGNYILLNNQYCEVVSTEGAVYVGANRAYIKLDEISTTPTPIAYGRRRISMGVQGQNAATGMDELNASETPVKVMIDGQLFILRGEKMYNANGQLVK